jgi:hypothetical protein
VTFEALDGVQHGAGKGLVSPVRLACMLKGKVTCDEKDAEAHSSARYLTRCCEYRLGMASLMLLLLKLSYGLLSLQKRYGPAFGVHLQQSSLSVHLKLWLGLKGVDQDLSMLEKSYVNLFVPPNRSQ